MQLSRRAKLSSIAILIIAGIFALLFLERSAQDSPDSDSAEGARRSSGRGRLFTLTEEDVQSLISTLPASQNGDSQELVFARAPDGEAGWRITRGYEHDWPLDTSRRDRLVSRVLAVRPRRVISEREISETANRPEGEARESAEFGFETPDRTILVRGEQGTSERLVVGREAPGGGRYVLLEAGGRRVVAIVGESAVDHLRTTASDLRERRLFSFDPGKTELLEFARGDEPPYWRIESRARADDRRLVADYRDPELVLTRPYPAGYGLDTGALGDMLDALPAFRVERFVSDAPGDLSRYGLETGEAQRLRIELDGQTEADMAAVGGDAVTLFLGDNPEGEPSRRYARVEGYAPVFTLRHRGQLDEFDGFRLADKFALVVAVDSVDTLTVTSADGRRRITADDDRQTFRIEDERGSEYSDAATETGTAVVGDKEQTNAEENEPRSVSRGDFIEAFTRLIGVRAEGETQQKPGEGLSVERASIHVRYTLRDGSVSQVWLVPDGDDYRIVRPVERELGAPFVVSARSIERGLNPLWEL
ncbi:MAG: DUF4340 domain-containing protein [Spirochaetales bacterium]